MQVAFGLSFWGGPSSCAAPYGSLPPHRRPKNRVAVQDRREATRSDVYATPRALVMAAVKSSSAYGFSK